MSNSLKNQLIEVLGDCKFEKGCSCIVKSGFENVSISTFHICDSGEDLGPVKVITEGSGSYQLTVINENEADVCVAKLDKCILTDNTKKCDCLIFDEKKIFLVEIKESNMSNRRSRRKDAITQLESTINYLIEKAIDLKKLQTFALVCFKTVQPRIVQASRNSAVAIFREKYGIPLQEGNLIRF